MTRGLVAPITLGLEYEVNVRRLQAAIEFARLNHMNRWRGAKNAAWLGIASAGKSYYDLMQALRDLGIGEDQLDGLGIRIAKFGMTFPLDGEFAREFAEGLDTILVIEEKRSFLELHLRDALYAMAARPVVIGKIDAERRAAVAGVGRTGSGQDRDGGRRGWCWRSGPDEKIAARVAIYRERGGAAARGNAVARVEFLFGMPA